MNILKESSNLSYTSLGGERGSSGQEGGKGGRNKHITEVAVQPGDPREKPRSSSTSKLLLTQKSMSSFSNTNNSHHHPT